MLTFTQYQEHSQQNPDCKYTLIEGKNSETYYVPIIRNPYSDASAPLKAKLYEQRERANLAARRQLRKKVSKHEKGYSTRLGYHTCTSQYTADRDVPSLAGSSLNRKKRKLRSRRTKNPEPCEHVMSKRSKGKIRDKATAFFRSCQERIFVTLTFIQHVDDRTGWKILNKFLTMARREIPGFEYLVIAEHQNERKDKTIHFHLLTNRRMPVRRWNNLWVLQQYNEGLVGRSKTCGHKKRCSCDMYGPDISKEEIQARYDAGTIQEVLNPLDIDRAYCISAISWYLTKYVTKQQTGEKFGCLTWHCSRRVSRLFTTQAVSSSTFRYMLTFRNYKVNRETGQMWEPQQITGKFFSVVFINNKPAVLQRLKMMETVNRWIIEKRLPDKMAREDLTYIDEETYRKIFEGRREPDETEREDLPENFLPSHQTSTIWDELPILRQ